MSVETGNKRPEDETMEKTEFQYDAFISYRHAPLDMYVAETLHKKLESFKVPKLADKETKKLGKSGIKRIFRDRDELPLAGNLSDPIMEALASSEYLIVICSPRIIESLWCQKEIETFIKLRGIENVFAILIEGEPEDSFPKQLCAMKQEIVNEDGTTEIREIPLEPLAADVRGKDKAEVKKKLKSELLRLVAPMIGCTYDDLKQRHKMRRLRRMLMTAAIICCVCVAFGAFSTYQALRIKTQSDRIQKQSEEILEQSQEIQMQSQEIQAQSQSLLEFQTQSLSATALELYRGGDRMRALLVALAGVPKDLENPERPVVADSEAALSEILQVYGNRDDIKPFFLFEHDTVTSAIALSPTGTRLVTTDRMGQIYSWNMDSGELLAKIAGPMGMSSYNGEPVFLSEDRVLVFGTKGLVCLNTEDLSPVWSMEDCTVTSAAVAPDYSKFAVVVDYYNIEIYDAENGAFLASYQGEASGFTIGRKLVFSEDGTKILFSDKKNEDEGGIVRMIDAMTGQSLHVYELTHQNVDDILYTKEDELYVISHGDFNLEGNSLLIMQAITCFEASGDKRWEVNDLNSKNAPICIFGENVIYRGYGNVSIISRTDGHTVKELYYTSDILNISVDQNNGTLAAALTNGTIEYRVISDITFSDYSLTYIEPTGEYMTNMKKIANQVVLQPSESNRVYIYRTALGNQADLLAEQVGYLSNAEFLNEELMIAYSMTEGTFYCFDAGTKQMVYRQELENETISGVLPLEERFVIIGKNAVYLFESATGNLLEQIDFDAYVDTWTYLDETLFVQTLIGGLSVFTLPELKQIAVYEDADFTMLNVSSDGKQIIGNADYGPDLRLNLETGEFEELETDSLICVSDPQKEFCLMADELTMTVSRLRFGGNTPLQTMEAQVSYMEQMGFSPDGTKFFVQYKDGRLEIYDSESFDLLKTYSNFDKIGSWIPGTRKGSTILYPFYTQYKAYVLNEDLEVLYQIPNLLTISPDNERLYILASYSVYSYPVYDLQMLVEEALTVLGDRQLTPEEKEEYNIN